VENVDVARPLVEGRPCDFRPAVQRGSRGATVSSCMRSTLVALSLLLLPSLAHAEQPPAQPLSLSVGQSHFWWGGSGERTFELDLAPGGHLLRVAYDTPSRESSFTLEITGPDGTTITEDGSNVFAAEAFAETPAAGRWSVTITPAAGVEAAYRMRAKLEAAPPAPGARRALLPNLRAVPPYELGFVAPANPANAAYPPDTVNPPLSAAGVAPLSCAPDELAPVAAGGGGATECLRLTSGPINVGDGPFVKTFKFLTDSTGGHLHSDGPYLRGDARQEVFFSDGTIEQRPAGTYSFHTTHAHFHDDGVLTYELFRVEGDTLEPAGAGTKSGFCPADQLMGEWRRFTQAPAGHFGEGDTISGSCYGATDDGVLALTRGWGDVYRWQRPGQYVEWSGNGDGEYVLRATVDKSDTTLELDEADNSAYTRFRVSGTAIDLLERGWGTSHLDPAKLVFTGIGPAAQDPWGAAPAAVATVSDAVAPRVSRARLRGRTLRFRLSEAAKVAIGVRGWSRTVAGRRGRNVVQLPRGARRLRLRATDAAGNQSRSIRVATGRPTTLR
jgi:hypothetical protein